MKSPCWAPLWIPVGKGENIVAGYVAAILVAEQILQQDFERIGETIYMPFLNRI